MALSSILSLGLHLTIFLFFYYGLPFSKINDRKETTIPLIFEEELEVSNKCEIFDHDSFDIFSKKKILEKKFDLIFIDPPYQEKNINLLIENIIKKKILNKKGVIIIHRHKKDEINITTKLRILDTRFYGISKIIIGR